MEEMASKSMPQESPSLVNVVPVGQRRQSPEPAAVDPDLNGSGTVDYEAHDGMSQQGEERLIAAQEAASQTETSRRQIAGEDNGHVENDETEAVSAHHCAQTTDTSPPEPPFDGVELGKEGSSIARGDRNVPDPQTESSSASPTSIEGTDAGGPVSITNDKSLETKFDANKGREVEGTTTSEIGVSKLRAVDSGDPSSLPSNSGDDITSRAAIALAAVAVAANAKHSSPSAAAQAARELAPGIMPGAGMSPRRNEDMKVVSLKDVKRCMKTKPANPMLFQRLANGENDAFLRYLLFLEFFRVDDEIEPDVPTSPSATPEPETKQHLEDDKTETQGVFDEELAALASERVRCMLDIVGGAYSALVGLLPDVSQPQTGKNDDVECEFDGIETPHVIPDLLPPCTSSTSDATAEFFRECSGSCEIEEETAKADEDAIAQSAIELQQNKSSALSEASHSSASSVLSSMFTSVKRSSISSPRASLTGVFRKRNRRHVSSEQKSRGSLASNDSRDDDLADGEYSVLIEREMLGLTVENVLERTVVRTVLPGGAAKSAGAQVGSLIMKVGNVPTKNLTHFETIDELRQSQRPLRLVMRKISPEALSLAREEMGRLIRGAGFGMVSGSAQGAVVVKLSQDTTTHDMKMTSRRPQIETYSRILHERWTCDDSAAEKATGHPLDRAAEKLVWILTLIIYGLENEAGRLPSIAGSTSVESHRENQHRNQHDSKDYADASRSISKVLLDFVKKNVDISDKSQEDESTSTRAPVNAPMSRRGRRLPPHPPPPPAGTKNAGSSSNIDPNKPLIQIGDVLHRTYTFLADPTSPPAALLRGEVIAFLCDVLDIDTQMELSEEENASSTAGEKAGPISDLGSAGSLLKLIILNCSMMRSPDCGTLDNIEQEYLMNEQTRRFGYRKQFSKVDVHRLHAGNRFLAVVHRLAASRSLSARVTACSLGPVLWGHLDFPHQLQLRGVITRALHDVDVIVRKSTATVLHEIAELVFDPRCVPWLVLMCERAMSDPEPQLRSAAMTLTWHLAEHLPNAFLGDASQGSRSLRRLPPRTDPTFAEVYLLQCKLLPVATRLAEDRAPSVRLAVAAQCDRLCNALGDHWSSVVIDVLQALLADSDERVRSEAILCVPRLVETVIVSSSGGPSDGGVGVLQALLPVSIKLQKDPRANVRASLATTAGELLTLLVGLDSREEMQGPNTSGEPPGLPDELGSRRYKIYVDETLIPLVQQLLHDADPEVTGAALRAVTNASRGSIREIRPGRSSTEVEDDTLSLSSFHSLSSIEKKEPVFIPVLSESQVLRLLPTLADLANSKKWRVRQGAVEIVPALLGCTNELKTRTKIAQLCITLMSDHVDAVRRTAAECLCLGGGSLGSHGEDKSREWISSIVLPHTRECAASADSKQRMLSLKMIEVTISNGVGTFGSAATQDLLEVAASLSTDRVANVRLNVGRVIGNVVNILDDAELSYILNALKEQVEQEERGVGGGDRDVLYFAKRAIARANTRLEEGSTSISVSTPDTVNRD